jgi:thiol:disulfide interchange protein
VQLPFGELMNYGYKGPATLLAQVKFPATVSAAPVRVTADAQWLACTEEVCVPEKKTLTLAFNQAKADQAGAGNAKQNASVFAAAQAALPVRNVLQARFHITGGQFQLRADNVGTRKITSAEFFPEAAPVIVHNAPQVVMRKDNSLWLETSADTKTPPDMLAGVLVLTDVTNARTGYQIDAAPSAEALVPAADADIISAPVASSTQASPKAGGLAQLGFGAAFASAVLGGLLLNLMPCVFPILALKAFSLARAGESESRARRDGLAYTGGVLLTFGLIGGILLAVRSSGSSLGWGFQLQDPRMVAVLGLFMVLIALNLAGLFDVRMSLSGEKLARKDGAAGAFWTGALAVLMATPCTAPFMAGALGAALVLPPAAGMAVFLGLGLGMALPFLLLGYVPALRRLLPKPGAWMETFKQFLAFPMLATALWLFWVVGQLTDASGMALALGAALMLGLGCWLWQRGPGATRAAAVLALLAAVAVPFVRGASPVAAVSSGDRGSAATVLAAEPYSDARLAALRSDGRPVFAYFTADWCISCKVNEKVTLTHPDVASAFASKGVAVLVGDWTKRDDVLGKVLERHGRAGVPLYLYFPAGNTSAQPQILPQLLTPEVLTTAINAKET